MIFIMSTLNSIAEELYPICLKVEREIVGQKDNAVAVAWAKANASRHARSIVEIQKIIEANNLHSLSILNASGLACGHQDFAICAYFKKRMPTTWVVYESPASPYLPNQTLHSMLKEYGITLELSDFTDTENLYGTGTYDAILFTEIAEHLEHSVLLRALHSMRERLAEHGQLLLTTPNFASLGNRIGLLRGNGDLAYWGDGQSNMKQGLWGHIVYYDIRRMRRLLADSGLVTVSAYTFWYKLADTSFLGRCIYALSRLMRNGQQTMLIMAKRGAAVLIPDQI
jgi:hypothetical protein